MRVLKKNIKPIEKPVTEDKYVKIDQERYFELLQRIDLLEKAVFNGEKITEEKRIAGKYEYEKVTRDNKKEVKTEVKTEGFQYVDHVSEILGVEAKGEFKNENGKTQSGNVSNEVSKAFDILG